MKKAISYIVILALLLSTLSATILATADPYENIFSIKTTRAIGEPASPEVPASPEDQSGQEQPPAEETEPPQPLGITINVDGVPFESGYTSEVIDGLTYVSLRDFCEQVYQCQVSWNPQTYVTTITRSDISMTLYPNKIYTLANGRYYPLTGPILTAKDGKTIVPIKLLTTIFCDSLSWDQETKTVTVTTNAKILMSGDQYYNSNNIYWLSRIINAESGGQPLAGKVAVGNVIQNRVRSTCFPDTIYSVIFDRANGTQFTPTQTGAINKVPNLESIIAAKLCLEGYATVPPNALYFINRVTTPNCWVVRHRTLITEIGAHSFYA